MEANDKNNNPLISIIIPVYNIADKLDIFNTTINSVINQSYKNIEIVLVNDGSSDKTDNLIREFIKNIARESNISFNYEIHPENLGTSEARNTGIKISKGGLIAFLDSDDIFMPDYLSEACRCFMEKPDIDVVFTAGYYYVNFLGLEKVYFYNDLEKLNEMNWANQVAYLIRSFPFPIGSATVCRRDVLLDVSFSKYLNKSTCEDVNFAYQLLLKKYKLYFQATPLLVTRSFLKFPSRAKSSSVRCDEYTVFKYLFENSRLPLIESIKDKVQKNILDELHAKFRFDEQTLIIQSLLFKKEIFKLLSYVALNPKLYKPSLRYFLISLTPKNKFLMFVYNLFIFIQLRSSQGSINEIVKYLNSLK